MDNEMKNTSVLNDAEVEKVSGGAIPWMTPSQYSIVSTGIAAVIQQILQAAKPNYAYSDKGANFTSLIYDWGEYVLHVDGKSENDPKAKMIELTLRANRIDVDGLRRAFILEAENKFGQGGF